jgi:O-antigen ligase
LLEAGLCALIVVAPLPFGSVGPRGRLVVESLAFLLAAIWMLTAARARVALPPRAVTIAMLGLLVLPIVQLVPVGAIAVRAISPAASALRAGLDPAPADTLSLAPQATASALRTGAALVALLYVATSVAAARGAGRIALAALVSAAFQGLYGLLVLAAGFDRIWNVPKTAYLDSATGTFVNRNHFAGFLAATLPLGVGLVIAAARRRSRTPSRTGWVDAVTAEGSRAMLLGLLAMTAAAGLLLSFSRAGIALGLLAIAGTVVAAGRGRPLRRAALALLVLAVAVVPLVDLGADRLVSRYAAAGDELRAGGGRVQVAKDTLGMVAAFPAAGAGLGSFTWVYPAFSAPDVRLHYTHAHDDLLQLAAEGGLPAVALLAVALAATLPRIAGALRASDDPLLAGAACGLAALLLHGLIDFDFHIPADAAIAAILAGVLFGLPWNGRT